MGRKRRPFENSLHEESRLVLASNKPAPALRALYSEVTRGMLLKLSARLGWSLSERETLLPASWAVMCINVCPEQERAAVSSLSPSPCPPSSPVLCCPGS